MLPIGLSCCGKPLAEELFAAYAAAGISHMEISLPTEAYTDLNYRELRAFSNRHGVLLWSFHLPFFPFSSIDISRPDLAKGTVAYLAEMIKRAADIGMETFVIHASGEPIAEEERPARMDCACESLYTLAEIAASCGGRIAVENLPRTCLGRNSQDMLALVSVHDRLRICFDSNHLLGEDPFVFLRAVGKYVVTTHISDYDFTDEKHWLPGEGALDFHRIFTVLKEQGYAGPWLYELGFAAPASHPRSRPLTCADFVRNAQEIFAGEKLTVVE